MDQDEAWHAGRPRSWPHCVRWGPSSPLPKGHSPLNGQPISVVAKWLDGLRCRLVWGRPRPRRLCVRWDPAPPSPKRGQSPHPIFGRCLLWPSGWMDQDATWYGGRPRPNRHCVRWGPSSLPKRGTCLLWPNGCMHQDTTWYLGRPQPRRHCVGWGCSSPSPKGAQPPNFWPMSFVAKQLDGLRCHLVWSRSRPRQLCVRWGPSSPRQKGTAPTQFSAHVYYGHGCPSQLLLSSCYICYIILVVAIILLSY